MSILEVMIAVGVAVIGVLGVLALLPVASKLAQQGINDDRKTAAGVAATREFKIRRMANGDRWFRWGNNLGTPAFTDLKWEPGLEAGEDGVWGTDNPALLPPGDDDGDGIANEYDEAGWPGSDDDAVAHVPARAVCIDPIQVTRVRRDYPTDEHKFPLTLTQQLQMQRVTTVDTVYQPDLTTLLSADEGVLMANKIFQIEDDLLFDLPKDTARAPLQQFAYGVGSDGNWGTAGIDDNSSAPVDDAAEAGWSGTDDVRIKRQSQGDFSWMAMISPLKGSQDTKATVYNVSIVVFSKRDTDIKRVPGIERISAVTAFYTDGFTGGDIALTAITPLGTSFDRTDDKVVAALDIRQGNWIMLMQVRPSIGPVFRWYPVVSVDEEVTETADATHNLATRDISILGADWQDTFLDPDPLIARNVNGVAGDGSSLAQIAVFLPDVVGVFETTVRLDSSLIWKD